MSSLPPASGSKRRRVHDAVQQSVRRVRRTFRPSPSPPHPPSGPGSSSASSNRSPSPPPSECSTLTTTPCAQNGAQDMRGSIAGRLTPSGSRISGPINSTNTTSPRPSKVSKLKGVGISAWDGLKMTLRALERSADEFPPLRSAIDGLVACLDVVQVGASGGWHSQNTDYHTFDL